MLLDFNEFIRCIKGLFSAWCTHGRWRNRGRGKGMRWVVESCLCPFKMAPAEECALTVKKNGALSLIVHLSSDVHTSPEGGRCCICIVRWFMFRELLCGTCAGCCDHAREQPCIWCLLLDTMQLRDCEVPCVFSSHSLGQVIRW